MPQPTTPRADFSPERRAHVLAWIKGTGLLTSELSYEARLLAVVGTLICNDAGVVKQADLTPAMADPSIVQAARTLLREARKNA